MNELQSLLTSASRAPGDVVVFDHHDNVRGVHKRTAASVARHSIRKLDLPAFSPDSARIAFTPLGTEAGKRTKLSDAVLAGSRCAAAGAHLVIVPAAADAVAAPNGEMYFTKRETRLDVIEAAELAVTPDGDELQDSALPIYRALVDLETMPSLGVRIPLTRAEQKSYVDGQLADATLAAIAMGIARAVDATLLGAIMASNPEAFGLQKVAAFGLEWSELRALIGTNGTGAVIAANGTLVALTNMSTDSGGIPAELTPVIPDTVIGAFNRAAVAVSEDIALIAERTDLQGGLVLTAWVSMQALLPRPEAF